MAEVYHTVDDDEDEDDKYGYFPDKFRIYKGSELSCLLDDKTFYELHAWVFWSRYDYISQLPPLSNCNSISESWITNWGIRDKIKSVLQTLSFNCLPTLAQFWAPVTIQNRCLLTTQDQPFCLFIIDKGLCSYRMISMEYKFYVDGESEEELGLPGRVFRYKFLESTRDVRYYSTKEHPQGSHAVHCNVAQSLASPVFDPSSQSCVGVLELVTLNT